MLELDCKNKYKSENKLKKYQSGDSTEQIMLYFVYGMAPLVSCHHFLSQTFNFYYLISR